MHPPPASPAPARISSAQWWGLLAVIAVAGAALRLWGVDRKWLWWDELLSANFARGEWYSVITEALRFDPHPPLYYLQLHLWMALGGTSDIWLMLNPVAWSVAGIVGTGWVARRLFGDSAGWLAAALHAVVAGSVYKAVYVRMYTMIPALAVWAFWCHRRAARGEGKSGMQLAALAAEAAVAFSHGTGFLMLSGIYAYGLLESVRSGHWRSWLRWRLLSAAVLGPCLFFAWMKRHGATHMTKPGLTEIGRGLHWLVVNPESVQSLRPGESALVWLGLASAVWLAWLWLACRGKEARAIALACVLLPVGVYAFVSHAARPAWHPRNLTVVLPFFCLAAAGGVSAAPRLSVKAAACAVLAIMAVSSVQGQARAKKGDDFKPAAELTRRLTEPGDLVVFYGFAWDWFCFSWYHRGPDWGDPLASHSYDMRLPALLTQLRLTPALPLVLHDEVRQWHAGGALVTAEFFGPLDLSHAPRVIRVVSAPRFSPFFRRKLPPVAGRTLLLSRALPRGDVRVEVWQ